MARPEDLTVDYKKLLRLSVSDRVEMARSPVGRSYLASLTPSQYNSLFPSYYKNSVPSYSAVSSGGGGGGMAPSVGGGGGGITAPSGGGGGEATTPSTPTTTTAATKPGWLQRFEQTVLAKTGEKFIPPSGGLVGGATIPKNANKETIAALNTVASRHGLKPEAIAMMINLESGWNIKNKTGSYAGLTQMGGATFREAGGRLGGMTYEEYKSASPDKQILAYSDWLNHYKFQDQLQKHKINLSGLSAAQQAAFLQGMQFSPNGQSWKKEFAKGNYDYKTTNTKQARVLGSTSINDMVRYYNGIESKNPSIVQEAIDTNTKSGAFPSGPPTAATGIQKQQQQADDAAETKLTPGQKPTVSVPIDPETLKRLNKERPDFMAGRIRIGEGEGAFTAPAGSGGRVKGYSSVPYGIFGPSGLEQPGPQLGGTFAKMRGRGRTQIVNLPAMFDPKENRQRSAIQIHPAIAPRDINGDDVKDLISKGCIAVDPSQYDAFMAAYKKYYDENNGKVYFVNVPNPNGQHEWVITNKKPEGNVYTPQQAIESQKKTGEPIPEIALPPGLNQGIVEHVKTLNPADRMAFVENLQKYGDGAIEKINQFYQEDLAALPKSEQQKAEKGLVDAIKTEAAPTAFASPKEEAEYYQDLLVRAEKYGNVEIDSNKKGKGLCGKGSRGLAGALLNEKYFNNPLSEGGDSRAASLSGGNRYFQNSGFYNEQMSISSEQAKNTEYLNPLPIGTVISSQGGKRGYGHVQIKIGPNQWASDFRQGNRVLPGYSNFVVHTPNQAGIQKLDPRIVSDPATLNWAKSQGYTLSESQQAKQAVSVDDAAETPLVQPTPQAPTADSIKTDTQGYLIANEPVIEGQPLSQNQVSAINIARTLDENNYNKYPESVRRQYEQQTKQTPQAPTAEPVREKLTIPTFPSVDDPFQGIEFPEGMPKPNVNRLSPEYRRWASLQDRAELSDRIAKKWKNTSSFKKAFASPDAVSSTMVEEYNKAKSKMTPEQLDAAKKDLAAKEADRQKQIEAAKTEQAPAAEPTAEPPKQEETPKAMATGGTFDIPPGEDIAGVNMKTGKTEFYANSRENFSQLKVDPATLVNDEIPSNAYAADNSQQQSQQSEYNNVARMTSSSAPQRADMSGVVNRFVNINPDTPSAMRHLAQTRHDPYRNGTNFNV